MPKKYIKKRAGPFYDVNLISRAADQILKGQTYKEVYCLTGIPPTVLHRFIKGGCDAKRLGTGRKPVLTMEVEDQLAECLIARSTMGYPCDKSELKRLVQEYVTANNIDTPFTNGMPGNDWYYGFMRRHPRLSLKKPEQLQKARVSARDPFVVYEFFDMVRALYAESAITDSSAPLIFNADESGFGSDPARLRAIGQKGVLLSRVTDGSGRESTTVLACVSADGGYLPPLIVFKGLSVQPRWVAPDEFAGTMYAATKNGWMEESTFYQWFTKMFVPHVVNIRTTQGLQTQTALLYFDGHSSHISIRIIQAALENNIKLIKFPSHMTDKIQPLDVCVFGPIKTAWDKILVSHGKTKIGMGPTRLQKSEFGGLLGKLWQSQSRNSIKSGFRSTGLFPLNTDLVKDSWFLPDVLERYKKHARGIKTSEFGSGDAHILPPPVVEISNESGSMDPIDLSMPKPRVEEPLVALKPALDIIKIFANNISREAGTAKAGPSRPSRRLKHHTSGEVLTTEEVRIRLEEAETKRAPKKKACTRTTPQPAKRSKK